MSMKTISRRIAVALGVVAVAAMCRSVGADEISKKHDRWYAVRVMNKPIGWAHLREVDQPAGKSTHLSLHMELRRGNAVSKVAYETRFDETEDGRPIQSVVTTNFGTTNSKQTVIFLPNAVEIVVEQLGQKRRRTVAPSKQPWMPPAAAARYVEQQIDAGSKDIRVWSVDPSSGMVDPIETRMKLRGRENVEVLGKVVPAMVWDTSTSIVPGVVAKLYTDDEGNDLKTSFNLLPGVAFEMLLADRQIAQAQIDPPELLVSTFVTPDKPISDPREQTLLVYELQFTQLPATAENPDAATPQAPPGVELPTAAAQRVRWIDRHTAVVTVSLDDPVLTGDDLAGEIHLRASSMLNHEDPEVRRLVKKALNSGSKTWTEAEKSERMRQFVRDYVKTKDLSVGFGSASEVARTAQGDCTEHAVLLAAMLRAEGIPSRTIGGLVYVGRSVMGRKDFFGYHMWTQAWLPAKDITGATSHRWFDLDATGRAAFDATHIALTKNTLDDDEFVNELVQFAPMLGNLSIKVIETEK